jgi:hypothetical protein
MPITAPKVSRRGTRVGTAPPVDPLDGTEDKPVLVELGAEVTLLPVESDVLPVGVPVLTVALLEITGSKVAVVDADSTLHVLLVTVLVAVLADVLDAAEEEELEGVGWSASRATILISLHWSPMDRSYRFPKSPLMHRHHLVEPPIARDAFWHLEKPPV